MKESAETEVEAMECGASLAELEYGGVLNVPQAVKSLPWSSSLTATAPGKEELETIESLRSMIASDVLTDGAVFTTFTSPFEVPPGVSNPSGKRHLDLPLIYCDQTASNRPVKSIEQYLENVCLPFYGNTHTNTSISGSQSTAFVAEARQIVAEETNAKITGKASLDVVLFSGNGATSAVELLIDCLGIRHASGDVPNRPVVFVGPYEHHSNLVPWRESGCEIVMVPECQTTRSVDIRALERLLQTPSFEGRLKMGTFTAASNVTGKVSDVDRIAATLHRFSALALFDYATGAPYLPMDMNPPPSSQYPSAFLVAKDAIFLSPHKMIGGVGSPGVLIVKKNLVNQVNAPSRSGGGTVFYVTNTHHRFLSNRIERYEGGTPNVVGILRVGLAFLLKRTAEEKFAKLAFAKVKDESAESVPRSIEEYDCTTHAKVAAYLRKHAPNLVLLGAEDPEGNLPIFSFLIRFETRFLHFNYVSAILNDVFGIQSRGGCQCSGPYSQRLLGLTMMTRDGEVPNQQNKDIETALLHFKERAELLRPGYTRLSLPFKGLHTEEVDYVAKALVWVAEHGWALMCQYRCNHRTGEWRHYSRQGKPLGREERRWLSHYNVGTSARKTDSESKSLHTTLTATLSNADEILLAAKSDKRNISQALKMADTESVLGTDDAKLEELRWFAYPKECAMALSTDLSGSASKDLNSLLGALRPFAVHQEFNGTPSTSEASSNSENMAPMEGRAIKEEKVLVIAEQQLVVFRDGEHTGEALMEEIDAGIEEGELSEGCEIFDTESNEWRVRQVILKMEKEMKIRSPRIETAAAVIQSTTEGEPAADQQRTAIKKASRGSSAWGQGSVLQTASLGQNVEQIIPSTLQTKNASMLINTALSGNMVKGRIVKPPKKLLRMATQAIIQWEMLQDGDRLLLGLSGGKDSMSLLHCLLEFQRKLPIKFEIEVCTIDPMTPSFDPSPLIPYVESLGLKYHYIRDDIVSRAESSGKEGNMVSSLCAFCARMKRGNLYNCARRNNCNKLVLAQHLDDCAESFMMSMMHNGFLRTMKASYKIDSGDLSVIRPLVYCRESLMTDFAKAANLPVINENCPACFEEPKERARIKKLLNREEILFPNFYDNIKRSLIPLMHEDSATILRCYTEETVAKSRKIPRKEHGTSTIANADTLASGSTSLDSVRDATDDDLIMELARRKAERSRQSARVKVVDHEADDPTGQVCTLNGGNGSIPCRELME